MTTLPEPNDDATCGSCRFWGGRPSGLARDRGRAFPCRRHAPLPSRSSARGAEVPYTPHDFWCGDYQPLPPLPPCPG